MDHVSLSEITRSIEAAVADAERRGYERGLSDARKRIQDALTTDMLRTVEREDAPLRSPFPPKQPAEDAPHGGRKRAPKGLVRRVVTRELRNAPAGLTPAEIQMRAQGGDEKMIVASSYRSELRVGRETGRYRDEGGKWFLAEAAKTEDADQSNPSVFAFGDAERG